MLFYAKWHFLLHQQCTAEQASLGSHKGRMVSVPRTGCVSMRPRFDSCALLTPTFRSSVPACMTCKLHALEFCRCRSTHRGVCEAAEAFHVPVVAPWQLLKSLVLVTYGTMPSAVPSQRFHDI